MATTTYIKDIDIISGGSTNSYLIEPALYGAASTSDSGSTYTVTMPAGFTLITGATIQVKFAATNAVNATLKVNTLDAKSIYYNNEQIAANTFKANHVYTLVYDGSKWQVVGDIDTNTWRPVGTGANDAAAGNHGHGNISNGGALSAANQAVVTDGSNKITTEDLSSSTPAASGTATAFVTGVTQNAKGKLTSITKASLPTASDSVAGITKLGATGGAATYGHTHGNINNNGTIGTANAIRAVVTNASNQITTDNFAQDSPVVPTSGTTTSLEFIDTVSQGASGKITATKKKIPNVSKDTAGLAPKGAAVSTQSQSTKFLREDGSWAAPSYTTNTDQKVKQNANTENKEFSVLLKTTNDINTETGEVKFGATTNKLITINPSTGSLTVGGLINSYDFKVGGTFDANDKRTVNGFFTFNAALTNAPTTNHGSMLSIGSVGTPYQIFVPDASYYIYKRYYTNSAWTAWTKIYAGYADTAPWSGISSKPTTISGYGITDAKIASGVITLGSNTITPVTSVNGHTGSSVNVTAADLGLSKAMRFIGIATVAITDGSTTDPVISGYSTKTAGDVIIDKDSSREYVWSTTNKWELLGGDSSYKTTQSTVDSGAAATNKWVSRIQQNANGVVTATMGTLDTSGTWSGNATTATCATRQGVSAGWHKGRDAVVAKTTTIKGYSPTISIKTTNGSWEIGSYNHSSYTDKLIFSYVTDANYNSNTNSHVDFTITTEGYFSGSCASSAACTGNAATATTATNLSAKPSLTANGNNITVTAGGKTSDAFTVPYATSAGSATTAARLTANTSFAYTDSGLTWFDISGTAGHAVQANDTPTTAWWHILRFNHSNNNGYYTDLAIPFNAKSLYYKRITNGTVPDGKWIKVLDEDNTYAASSSDVSIAWNTSTTIATINGTAIKIKIPANPNTNTTYTITTGDANGQIKVTPSSGNAYNVSVKGLAALAYKASLTAADVGALASNTTITNVSFTGATDNAEYPILMKNSTGSTTTAAGVKFANTSGKGVTINPSSGTISATGLNINGQIQGSLESNYKTITIDGDANTYYPVIISQPNNYYPATLVNITRTYSETAPNTWNTNTHRGGLTCTFLWNGSRYWDGNGAGQGDSIELIRLQETYSTMVGKIGNSTSGLVVWLRGGGAIYHIFSQRGTILSVTVNLSTYTDSASQSFAPITTVDSANIESYRRLHVNANTATKLSNTPNNTTQFLRGDNTWTNQLANYIFNTTDIAEGSANLSTQATAHKMTFYRNGITIPYQMDNSNDGGMLRVRGTSESNCIFELGTWDDSGAGETIQFNYYPTTSQATPTYSVSVPKHSGTLVTTDGHGASGTWGISISGNAATATKLSANASNTTASFWRGDNTWSNEISGGLFKITNNGNTVTIGSANSDWCHFSNSANIPFYFNKDIGLSGTLGTSSYPANALYIGPKNSRSIYYVGTKATNAMITFLDNTSDGTGNGIKIGAGGVTVIGAGESAANLSVSAGTETLYLLSDGSINIESGGDTIANRIGLQVTTAGHIIPVKAEAANNNKQNLGASNNVWANVYATTFIGALSGNATTATDLSSKTPTLAVATESNEIKVIDLGNNAPESGKAQRHAIDFRWYSSHWAIGNLRTGNTASAGFGFSYSADGTTYTNVAIISNNGDFRANAVYGAVWNDYAEYRESIVSTPGTCVVENDNGVLSISDERLTPGASIISDTYGFSQGETERARTPIAVAGRVLAYTYMPREMYHAGMAVCSAPGGTIDIMTREEIRDYPDCIIGYVSEIPDYEYWGTGNVKVNGRIWIKVK